MDFDPNELVEQPDPAAYWRRVQRDIAGLGLLILGALLTVVAAFVWEPIVGLALLGGYLMVAGGFLASGRTS
ncbi:hypothetical protein GCM10010404_81570 [Nonomuraea africana]|uniref:Membrane-bound ClpP family serine protease n=1 Tax=Nonomuraea africana TaxID=46171 RepID=A0ABR9KYC9_9ACTN|nr:hypothetical protein [Nonomuraea africana]MBE1566608.1 membrane-bound ClpP family serine protease [Nonomuraea africana]